MNQKMRLNKIELRMTKTVFSPIVHEYPTFEIVKWKNNNLFGREDEFEKVGNSYVSKNPNGYSCYYHESCFENKETCYVIAFIEKGIVEFIGNRAIELNNIQEYKDFLFLLRKGVSKSLRWKNK